MVSSHRASRSSAGPRAIDDLGIKIHQMPVTQSYLCSNVLPEQEAQNGAPRAGEARESHVQRSQWPWVRKKDSQVLSPASALPAKPGPQVWLPHDTLETRSSCLSWGGTAPPMCLSPTCPQGKTSGLVPRGLPTPTELQDELEKK